MQHLDRRDFLGTLTLAGLTGPIVGGSPDPVSGRQDSVTDVRRDVTRSIARYVIATRPDELPAAVRKEACRTLLNWVGCAVGGSRHATLDAAIAALAPFSGPPQASVLGRRERMDILHAALMNGISSHVFDFDDTPEDRDPPGRSGRLVAAGAVGAAADVRH
jgi:2-methylcitrate dehydratase PrpD